MEQCPAVRVLDFGQNMEKEQTWNIQQTIGGREL